MVGLRNTGEGESTEWLTDGMSNEGEGGGRSSDS